MVDPNRQAEKVAAEVLLDMIEKEQPIDAGLPEVSDIAYSRIGGVGPIGQMEIIDAGPLYHDAFIEHWGANDSFEAAVRNFAATQLAQLAYDKLEILLEIDIEREYDDD